MCKQLIGVGGGHGNAFKVYITGGKWQLGMEIIRELYKNVEIKMKRIAWYDLYPGW